MRKSTRTDTWLWFCPLCGEIHRINTPVGETPPEWEKVCPVDKWMLYLEKKAKVELRT